jgi:hypothetical protein
VADPEGMKVTAPGYELLDLAPVCRTADANAALLTAKAVTRRTNGRRVTSC